MLSDLDRKLLGSLLVEFDEAIDKLDRAVFEAAYHPGVGNLDAQKERAVSPDFQPQAKRDRDKRMEQRNLLARLLGFQSRQPHDLSPRDYFFGRDGMLLPRGII